MKVILLSLFFLVNALADDQEWTHEKTVLKEYETEVSVNISQETVARYEYFPVGISLIFPELNRHTGFNHWNRRANNLILMTQDTLDVEDILQGSSGTEKVILKRRIVQDVLREGKKGVCAVNISEEVNTNIRGYNFESTSSIYFDKQLC